MSDTDMTTTEAATALHLTPEQVLAQIAIGDLPGLMPSEIEAFANRHTFTEIGQQTGELAVD